MRLFSSPVLDRTITHGLTERGVVLRLQEGLADKLLQAFPGVVVSNFEQQWNGSSGSFSCIVAGKKVTGIMSVSSSELYVHVQLPHGAGLKIDVEDTGDRVEAALIGLLSQ